MWQGFIAGDFISATSRRFTVFCGFLYYKYYSFPEKLSPGGRLHTSTPVRTNACQHPAFKLFPVKENYRNFKIQIYMNRGFSFFLLSCMDVKH
jgi:hypothetical protein